MMYKYLGNYKIDFDINLDELKFNSHKIYSHNDKDSKQANSVGYRDNTEFMKVWGEDYPQYLRDYVEKFPMKVVNSNLVCMSDWIFGQVIMIEDLVITNWKKGDAYIWDSEALHMSANGSIGDKLTMIISGFYED